MTAEEILPIEVPFDRTTPSIVLPEHAASMTRDALSAAPDPTITLATLKAVSVATQEVTDLTENPFASHAAMVALPVPSDPPPVKVMFAANTLIATAPSTTAENRNRKTDLLERVLRFARTPRPSTVPRLRIARSAA